MGFPKLFSPVQINQIVLKNRLIMAPMGTSYHRSFNETGAPEQKLLDYFRARARGGASLIMVGTGSVDTRSPGKGISLCDERFVNGLRMLTDVIHEDGAEVGIQLQHPGRQRSSPDVPPAFRYVAPSPIPWHPSYPRPKELSGEEVAELVTDYVNAAAIAMAGGFDVIELHAGHGYLVSQFMSPRSNKRNDEFGGSLENRARFGCEIISRIRRTLGTKAVLSARLNGSDLVADGMTNEDAVEIAAMFEAAGLDMISVSGGVYGSIPDTIMPYYAPPGCFVEDAARMKARLRIPVAVAGRLGSPVLAEELLQSGRVDIIAMGRPLIADPDLPEKAAAGRLQEIRPCMSCNQGCGLSRLFGGLDTVCMVNPFVGREGELPLAPVTVPKKVAVIGGGPAGLEAARVAAGRGHRISVFDQNRMLGGQWCLGAVPPHKQHFLRLVDYYAHELRRLGVDLELGKEMTPATVAELRPDAVIVATGSVPLFPAIPVVERSSVVTAHQVLRDGDCQADVVLIVGGNSTGLETAHYLMERGKRVTVIEMTDQVGAEMDAWVRTHLLSLMADKVTILTGTKLEEVQRGRVVVSRGAEREVMAGFDLVVLAVGVRPRNQLATDLRALGLPVFVAGDAAAIGNGRLAIASGADIALKI